MTAQRKPKTMSDPRKRFYVQASTSKGHVIGYGVYDCVGGMVSQHGYFSLPQCDLDVALRLANTMRDDMNAKLS